MPQSMPKSTATSEWLTSALGSAPPPTSDAQTAARAALASLAFPTSRDEEWRFTDVSQLEDAPLTVPLTPSTTSTDDVLASATFEGAHRVVLVDGRFDANLSTPLDEMMSSLPSGSYVGTLASAPESLADLRDAYDSLASAPPVTEPLTRGVPEPGAVQPPPPKPTDMFRLLNTAFATPEDTFCVYLPAGTKSEATIHIVHVSTAFAGASAVSASFARVLLVLGEGAKLDVAEELVCCDENADAAVLAVPVLEAALAPRAKLHHAVYQRFGRTSSSGGGYESSGGNTYCLKSTIVSQAEESVYDETDVSTGAHVGRNTVTVSQRGPRTATGLRSFTLASAPSQTLDVHTSAILSYPEGTTSQLHKCIVGNASAKGVFDGNVQVLREAQRTDAQQLTRTLLLEPRATIHAKPNLQIVADDVSCTHGCTISDLDDTSMFYLQSRGISREAAREQLVLSFGLEVVEKMRPSDQSDGDAWKDLVSRVTADVRTAVS